MKKYNKNCHEASAKNSKLAKQKSTFTIKEPSIPVLKKPCCYINNQNYKIKDDHIEFPALIDGKVKRIAVRTSMTDRQKLILSDAKLGILRIVYKGKKIVAQIVYEAKEQQYLEEGNIMGVDLGIKCPAVSYISDGHIKFYGNGRKNKYMRRHYKCLRQNYSKAKNIDAVKRINNKEQRIMKDIDHKLSREIIETAISHNVKIIKLERLANIRSTTRKSRKTITVCIHGHSIDLHNS